MRLRLASLALAVLATSLLASAAPGAAVAATRPVAAAPGACSVTGGHLTWGFKESFRSYISGTIAKGSWEPIDDATYETPVFGFPAAEGEFDPATGTGTIAFSGAVRFTGHDGLLDTTIAHPVLELTGAAAQLRLDVTGVSMEDALAGDTANVQTASQIAFVDLDTASAPVTVGESSLTGTAVPTSITADGYAEFGNYETGTAFDPITFEVQLDCAAADPVIADEPAPTATPVAADAESAAEAADATWLWGVGGGLLAVAAGVAVAVALSRRRTRG